MDTVCITIEDYNQDFVHLKDRYYNTLMDKIKTKVCVEYLKALVSRLVDVSAGNFPQFP